MSRSWNPAVPRAQRRREALAAVLAPRLHAGSLVPSSRAMARALGVSRMAAWADIRAVCAAAGLVVAPGPRSRMVVVARDG